MRKLSLVFMVIAIISSGCISSEKINDNPVQNSQTKKEPEVWIEVHDIGANYNLENFKRVIDVLEKHPSAYERAVLFVIPNYHGGYPFHQNGAFVEYLKLLQGNGYILSPHGYTHLKNEFVVSGKEAEEIIQESKEEFEKSGFNFSDKFLPPYWNYTDESLKVGMEHFNEIYLGNGIYINGKFYRYPAREYTNDSKTMNYKYQFAQAIEDYQSSEGAFRLSMHLAFAFYPDHLKFLDAFLDFIEKTRENPPPRYSVIDSEIPVTYYGEVEIPVTYHGEVDGVYVGYQVVPQNIALKAREAFYEYSKTKNETRLQRGLFLTNYLIEISTPRDNGGVIVWEYDFQWPSYNMTRGWTGALAQAGGLKALMLAYQATGNEGYLEYGDKVLKAFDVDISKGGLRAMRKEGNETYYWYPEYAKKDPPYVLNGFITSVIWIKEYHDATGNQLAKNLYDEGIKSLIHYLPAYSYGGNWSYYDALGHESSRDYHQIHVNQMKELYSLTKDPIFQEYYDEWKEREN